MFKGFYTLSSSMITQNRQLDVISNNLSNTTTPGYKADNLVSGSFKEEVLSMSSNNIVGAKRYSLGTTAMITTPYETVTDFSDGSLEETGGPLDFAIMGKGFFQIQGQEGMIYTRNGSFIVDDEGYISMQSVGRVMGNNGPIYIETDDFNVESDGSIVRGNGVVVGKLNIMDFNDYADLQKVGDGLFSAQGEGGNIDSRILWKTVETSNVSPVEEMTSMMVSQRVLQSAAQVLKMYDQISAKATTEIGKV